MKHLLVINIMLAVFLVLAVWYSAAIPLGEGPDEPGHAAYAFFLARAGRLPVQRGDPQQSDVPGEGHQPPLAYALAAPLAAWLSAQERAIDLPGNPHFTWAGGAEDNAVAHGSREYPPWQGAVLAWHLMRLVSVALGTVTVACTYLAARALDCRLQIADCRFQSGDDQSTIYNLQSAMPLLAAGLVAFNPQFLFISALVTNDALLTALSAVLLWLIMRDDRALRSAIAIGIVLGLALLTKQNALILAPVALLARGRRAAGGANRQHALIARTSFSRFVPAPWQLAVAGVAVLVAGWWYIRNLRLYGDLLGLSAFRGEFATQPFQVGSLAAWSGALAQLHTSFWARFGWMNVAAPTWAIWVIVVLELAGLAGLVRATIEGRRRTDRDAAGARRPVLGGQWAVVALPALAFAWVVGFALTAGLVAWQGRLLFPALPALALLLARGLTEWTPRGWRIGGPLSSILHPLSSIPRSSVVAGLVLCPLVIIALWIPDGVIRPAYPPHTLPETEAQARIGTAVYAKFRRRGERSVELRGWRIDGPQRPGAVLDVTLIWHAAARQGRDWVVFIHVVDAQGRIIAEDNRPPRDGLFPMTQWAAGDWVEDRHPIRLPVGLAPGAYTLRVGLYDPQQQGRRAGVYDQQDTLRGDSLDLGRIMVVSSQ